MVCGEQMQPVGEKVACAVGEAVLGFADDNSGLKEEGKITVERDFAEADHDTDARESLNFSREVGAAVANLLGQRLIARRSAANDGGDPGVAKLEAIVAIGGTRFTREAKLVENGVHEVAGAVAGEWPAGAVGSVSSRRKAEDEDASTRITETGDRTCPVRLVLIGAAFGLTDVATVTAKARAELAGNDGPVNLLEKRRRHLCVGGCHCIP